MTFSLLSSPGNLEAAAGLALGAHQRLRAMLPFLPERRAEDLIPRLEWMARDGVIIGLWEGCTLSAFLGAFPVDGFRNAGRGSIGPDWGHGTAPGMDPARTCRRLYRELAPCLLELGCRIHAFGFYATEADALAAMELTGFGRIVLDAARPTTELLADADPAPADLAVVRAAPREATELARLEAGLVAHIAAAPVLMPDPRGRTSAQWAEWLSAPAHLALLAYRRGRAVGYIKAQEPQLDVTYAVHGESTLAINGMFVEPEARCTGVGRLLLASLARHAEAAGQALVSVDCETTNLEAYAFWSRWFRPVTWSLERRV